MGKMDRDFGRRGWYGLAVSTIPLIFFCRWFLPAGFDVCAAIGALFAICLIVSIFVKRKSSGISKIDELAIRVTGYPLWILLCVMIYQASGGVMAGIIAGYVLVAALIVEAIVKVYRKC